MLNRLATALSAVLIFSVPAMAETPVFGGLERALKRNKTSSVKVRPAYKRIAKKYSRKSKARVAARPRAKQVARVAARGTGGTVRASYYGGGEKLSSHMANGKRFNPNASVCAHRTLPFGTRVQVTFNGRTAICTVSDRGPHKSTGRSIDLSRGVAAKIGMIKAGVGSVRMQVLR